MDSIAPGDIVIGVDTHKDNHVAFACEGLGRRLDDLEVPATNEGYTILLGWAEDLGRARVFGVEGTGSYGIGSRTVPASPQPRRDRGLPAAAQR